MQVSISTILSLQLVLVLVCACGVFIYTILIEEESIDDSVAHGEKAVSECFDQYLTSIKTTGESFITDISLQLKSHVGDVVDRAEAKARAAATAVERMGFMDVMEHNGFHGSQLLPSLGWMLLGQLEEQIEEHEEAVVSDIVVATLNSTEEFNNWAWFGLASRNPNSDLNCDFYYYRNATDLTSHLWCVDDLYEQPDMISPSIWPHTHSPAIVRLQDATPRDYAPIREGKRRPLSWMPLDFFVWTANHVALTSVVSGVFGPDGTCQGFAAANVKFSSVSKYLNSLVKNARYDNLSLMLIETGSSKILGTSIGSAIYKENQTNVQGFHVEQEFAADLSQVQDPLAEALNRHIEDTYGSVEQIPTPLITSAMLEGEEYFISFDSFERPNMNLTICAFLPHVSITGPTETQRFNAQISLDAQAEEMEDDRNRQLVIIILIGVGCLLVSALVASLTAVYLSLRIQALVNHMEKVRSQISNLVNKDMTDSSTHSTDDLCEPLPKDYFPEFQPSHLKDLEKIRAAAEDLCYQVRETWNTKQDVFRQALEQRQFTASIAHDIRNPLHGVLGIVSMMQNNIEIHRDKLPLLADTLRHMSILLNDMVDLSKIQGGKVTQIKKRFDAWDTIDEVVTLYQDTVVSRGGTLSCMDRSSLPLAYSDPIHVSRILTNFVSNASKYAAGCDIELRALVTTPERVRSLAFLHDLDHHFSETTPHWAANGKLEQDQYIVLACYDKGRGIPPSKLETVFEAYQQTHDSDRYKGAGLGLAIVKGLAIELGGGIGVCSEVGSGSLFWLVVQCSSTAKQLDKAPPLPRISGSTSEEEEEEEEEEGRTSFLPPSTTTTHPSSWPQKNGFNHTFHVLVVDDTNLNLMLVSHFLKRLGISSEVSSSAEDGLSKLRENPDRFSLILSDFNMPLMNGGEMCLEVRKDRRLRTLPFICTSGNVLSQDELDRYKIDDALMKPFTVDRLQQTIGPYLRWSKAAASSAAVAKPPGGRVPKAPATA